MGTDLNIREKLAALAYESAWELVHCVESGETKAEPYRRLAAKFLDAYADRYNDENCRFRARKIKNQTN
jgi:hypothetical protein